MNKVLVVLLMLLFFACEDQQEPPKKEKPLPSYIKSLVTAKTDEPYDGSYYIHARFTNMLTGENKEITFSEANSSMALRYDCVETGGDLSEHTVLFIHPEWGEQLEVSFYYNPSVDTTFQLCYADYLYANPWESIAGANIQYLRPVGDINASAKYLYLGSDCEGSYFRIIYIGDSRINGEFSTVWHECCGEQSSYQVTGDFSVPDLGYYRRL
ncbi:MAG TPA: hypothetical protein VFG54_03620 [Prolixibacteraceae bacterium]|nr:hypothetical protein [Prolixibacteraceae bacterium]